MVGGRGSSSGGLDGHSGVLHHILSARGGSGDHSSNDGLLHGIRNTRSGSTALGAGAGILGDVLSIDQQQLR
jgi:hypothetical protein